MQSRAELKTLVDFYATESEKNSHDCCVAGAGLVSASSISSGRSIRF